MAGETKSVTKIVPPPELTPEQTKFVAEWEAKGTSPPPFAVPAGGTLAGQDFTMNPRLWSALAGKATGANQELARLSLVTQLLAVVAMDTPSPAVHMEMALAHMLDIGPKDGLEGMLAAQMVSAHKVALDLLARGTKRGLSISLAEFYLRNAERLMRIFGLQLEALSRLRGKGPSEQTVTVEHVHVHEGGQAVVGNVTTGAKPAPGGGGESGNG